MDTPLLSTKLFVPPARTGLVPRPRLMKRLDAALGSPFTLVSAPAGFGKTTILTQWAATIKPPMRVAWVQLDEGDNDPVRFWDYFIAAVKTLAQSAGSDVSAMLHSPQGYTTEAVLTTLLNDVASTPEDFVLVMDDYHLIKAEAIHSGVTFVLDHCPPKMHLILATRVDPRLPLAHFRGRGTMIELGADDLRFTLDEANDFMKLQDVELHQEDLAALSAKAEGWIVGLKMAAMAMRGRKDVRQFVASFAGNQRFVMDYLVEEVLKRQPEDVRSFLLNTSVLERLTAPLCDALTGNSDGREMLARLEQSNLFLVPLDESRRWCRYHHLFAELLRQQLEVESGEERVKQLHRQASQWYEEHDFVDDAVQHGLAARDWEQTMRLVGAVADSRFKRGEMVTLFNWLKAIPEAVLSTDFYLYRQYSRTLIETGHLDAAEAALSNLHHTAQGDANLEGEVAALQADVAQKRGNLRRAIEIGEKALSLLSPDNLVFRCWASYRLGFNQHYLGLLDAAWARLTDAFRIAEQSGDRYIAAWSANFLAAVMHQRGHLRQALDMARRGLEMAGQSPGAAGGPYCRLSIIPYELNDLETASQSARLAIEGNRLTGDSASVVGYIYLSLACLAEGNATGAVDAMENCDKATRDPRVGRPFHARYSAARVVLAIRRGDLERASEWGRRLSDYTDCFPFEFEYVPARLLIAQGKKAEAAEQLQGVYRKAIQVDAQGLVIVILVCQALAAQTETEALSFLAEALIKGEPEGFVRTFVDEGKLLKPLLRKALAQGITPQYTARLLHVIETEEQLKTRETVVAATRTSNLLSERELEILRLVESGFSNKQIAERLVITVATTKTHIHNLCRKLDASTRTQALARARELKLT